MSWDNIINQKRVKALFKVAIEHRRLAHAYLFTGAQGIGKSAFAIELAKALQCEQCSTEACDKCPSCLQFKTLQSPNLFLIFSLPVGKGEQSGDSPLKKLTNDDIANIHQQIKLKAENLYHNIVVPRANFIKVNSIRSIRKSSALTTFSRGIKVFVIINADEMNEEASNALLKTLEEPYENSMFILTTAYPDKLLPTIVSRCQQICFDSITDHEIAQLLQLSKGLDKNRALLIARLANGNVSRAIEMCEKELWTQPHKPVDFLRTVLYKSREELLKLVDEFHDSGDRVFLERFLYDLQTWLRDALLMKEGCEQVVNVNDKETLKKFINFHPMINFDEVFFAIEKSILLVNKNVYIPLILINLSFDLRKSILRTKGFSQATQIIH